MTEPLPQWVPHWVRLVRAPNPGPMTLEGTNTWILGTSDASECVVIDPGPLHLAHLAAVAEVSAELGTVRCTLLTHGHPDHAEGAQRFAEMTGSDVLALDPAHVVGDQRLVPDGEPLDLAGLRIRTFATPGHTRDSVSFAVSTSDTGVGEVAPSTPRVEPNAHQARSGAIFTGDTILGRGTTLVAWPDGELGDYLQSLERLRQLGPVPVLPGHGPALPDIGTVAAQYLAHRQARLDQVRQALAAGARSPADVVAMVYADVDRALWPAAELSVRAQLDHLGHLATTDRSATTDGSVRPDRPVQTDGSVRSDGTARASGTGNVHGTG